AIAFGHDDVIAPARILYDFAKDHEALEIKGGVIQGEVAPVDQLKELSTLPDHDGLISMLLSVLQAPIRNLAYATQAVTDEKEDLEIKGCVIQGEVASVDQLKELSTFHDHNGLISMLLSVLKAPNRNLAYATQAVADEKEDSAE